MASQHKSGMVRWSAAYALDNSGMVRWSAAYALDNSGMVGLSAPYGLPDRPWSDIITGLLGACPKAVHAERYR